MARYKVSFEIPKFEIEVEAENKQEAEEKAQTDFMLHLEKMQEEAVKIEEIK